MLTDELQTCSRRTCRKTASQAETYYASETLNTIDSEAIVWSLTKACKDPKAIWYSSQKSGPEVVYEALPGKQ
jgi:hypothetical protein